MEKFKVICKASGKDWEITPRPTKIVTKGHFFWKSTTIVDEPKQMNGPSKDEICIVHDTYQDAGATYYRLVGYPHGGYDSKNFIPLDEIEETETEEIENTNYASN